MKRITSIIVIIALSFVLAACGAEPEKKPTEQSGCEVAMIAEKADAGNGTLTQNIWQSVTKFAEESEIAVKSYEPKDVIQEEYLASIKQAVDDGAKLIILPGRAFETTACIAQTSYPDVNFLLIDGVPHDESNAYATAANTISVVFAEEEAGYMAGYAAVKDGYTKLGFMGGQTLPEIKRYGYGFVQGAAAAAAETETKVEMNYKYTGAEEVKEVENLAAEWYKNGTQIIFAAGGNLDEPVIKAAEAAKGKVIGADMDKSGLSECVITSAMKGTDAAVETVLKSYEDKTFVGGTAFNYAAKNDGVMLEMTNSRFKTFGEDDYKKLFRQLKNGKIQLKKDTGVNSISELTGEWVTIKE